MAYVWENQPISDEELDKLEDALPTMETFWLKAAAVRLIGEVRRLRAALAGYEGDR